MESEESVKILKPNEEDGKRIWQLVQRLSKLDANSCYAYLLWSSYFRNYTLVAKSSSTIIGFVTSFVAPEKKNTLFIWQVGVDPNYRGKGIAQQLIWKLLHKANKTQSISALEASISPSNIASKKLFENIAGRLNTEFSYKAFFPEDYFPNNNHEKEELIHIAPISLH